MNLLLNRRVDAVALVSVAPISVWRANHTIPKAFQKAFHGLWIMAAFLALSMSGAPLRFGSETAVSLSSNTLYGTTVNYWPGNNATVTKNPPEFSWYAATNQLNDLNPGGSYPHWNTQTNEYRLRAYTNAALTGTAVIDVRTPFNFHPFGAPIPTNVSQQIWWRVEYITNDFVYCIGPTMTFFIPNGCPEVDRSVLNGTNYFFTNGIVYLFRPSVSGQEAAISNYLQTADARSLSDHETLASATTNSTWWTNITETPWGTNSQPYPSAQFAHSGDLPGKSAGLHAVLTMYRFGPDTNRWRNASMRGYIVTNINRFQLTWLSVSNNYWMQEYGDSQSAIPLRALVASYAWLDDEFTGAWETQLKTNVLFAGTLVARYWIGNDLWVASPYPTGTYVNHFDGNYRDRTNYCQPASSIMRQGNSHGGISITVAAVICVLAPDDPEIALFCDYVLRWFASRQSSFMGWSMDHIGMFGYVDVHESFRTTISLFQIFHIAFPQARLNETAFATDHPEAWSRMWPYRTRMDHGPGGDGRPSGYLTSLGRQATGMDLASLGGNGYMRQAYDLNREFSNSLWGASQVWADNGPMRYHFALPAPETNTAANIYPEDGYALAYSKSPGEFDCYTNGTGFQFWAVPRGSYQNHMAPVAGGLRIFYKGAEVLGFGGGGLDPYGYYSDSAVLMFVKGVGPYYGRAPYATSQREPWNARICNWGSDPICVFATADMTPAYTNYYVPVSLGLPDPRSNLVTKVKFTISMVRSNYYTFCAEWGLSSPDFVQFQWPLPWPMRYEVSSAALLNETAFSGDRYGTNSHAWTSNGFTYVIGNIADSAVPFPTRYPVRVDILNATNQYTKFYSTGTDDLVNPSGLGLDGLTNAIALGVTNSTLNPYRDGGTVYYSTAVDRAGKVWFQNSVAATNFTLTGTITIGEDPPAITRLSDRSYSDGAEVVSFFETNSSPASTIIFDMSSAAENPGGGGGETPAVRTLNAVRSTAGRVVR